MVRCDGLGDGDRRLRPARAVEVRGAAGQRRELRPEGVDVVGHAPILAHVPPLTAGTLARCARGGEDAAMSQNGSWRDAHDRSLADPDGFWGDAAGLDRLDHQAAARAGRRPAAVLPLVHRRRAQHLLQRARPARRRRPRRPAGARARLARDRHAAQLHLRAAARPGGPLRRRPAGARRREGRPGRHLHADGARGRHRDAGLRPHRRGALGGVRRLRARRARRPASTTRSRRSWCRRRAASSPRGSSSTSPCWTPPSSARSTSREQLRGAAATPGRRRHG